ncbi:MAG: UvrD-helicase domain-containing protein [Defluviitaleaceae bacterium]|nr:UvrD-helicase domain-containing protein [Defluviitaleaceae bacterium]
MDNFTPAQREAIMCNATEILVSAAAGSGKTAVLTERIVRHISEGVDIDRLLVVTFTEAASAEMRERIVKKLSEREGMAHQAALLPMADISTIHAFCRKIIKEHFQEVDLDPAFRVGDDAELSLVKSQVMAELFESEYHREDNDDFLDLADVYGGKTMDGRLEILVRSIHEFMESDPFPMKAASRYSAAFEDISDIDTTPWAAIAREELELGLQGAQEGLRQAITICNAPGGPQKYVEKLRAELQMLRDLQDSSKELSFEDMYHTFSWIDWGTLPRISAKDEVDPDLKERVMRIRNKAVKERVKKMVQGVFFAPPEKMASDLVALSPRVSALMRLASRFAEEYAKEKRAKNVLDFSDLEHFAIRILYPNGPDDLTPAPREQRYFEVLVDEYQDSNEIQDLILSAVAERRFMVGDVKQSIYRFRRANPGLFKKKYDNFTPVQDATQQNHQAYSKDFEGLGAESPRSSSLSDRIRIDLSHNFRSRPEVLSAVNFFFSQLMCRDVGDVEYDNNAALHAGHGEYPPLPENTDPIMQVELLDQSDPEDDEDPDTDEPISNVIAETRVLARCIKELLATRKVWDENTKTFRECRQGDIAILTRSFARIAGEVIEELKSHGIDAIADMSEGFFDQQEIKTAVAFLRITDNPRQDIELITALSSPVYALNADELFQISRHKPPKNEEENKDETTEAEEKKEDRPLDFYDKLVSFAAEAKTEAEATPNEALLASSRNESNHHMLSAKSGRAAYAAAAEKICRFLSDLEKWRAAAMYLPISRLIGFIYDTTLYPVHAANMTGGIIRQTNLRLLLERAIEFEETSLKGLFHFIRYIERLSEAGNVASAVEPSSESTYNNKVRLMTIHKSKGLEFPVVICAFLAKKFNIDDERRPVILHSAEGVGPYYVNTKLRTRSNTIARFSLARLTRRENLSEELRCLYVAMTRAKELLILTGRAKNLQKSMEKWQDHLGNVKTTLPMYYRRSASSYLDWLMPCLLRKQEESETLFKLTTHEAQEAQPLFADEMSSLPPERLEASNSEAAQPLFTDSPPQEHLEASDSEERNAINNEEATNLLPYILPESSPALPSKLAISEIRRMYDITPDSSSHKTQPPSFEPPMFIQAESGITSARMGSVLHKIVEHMDFHQHTTAATIEELIATLTQKNLLTPDEAKAVNRAKIKKLANSRIAERLRKAAENSKLYRETPFVLALPASQLYPAQENATHEKILVHGIIDCHFEENEKIIAIDFKSDSIPASTPLSEWAEIHRIQMEIYAQALTKATGKPVSEILLYAFARGEEVALMANNA